MENRQSGSNAEPFRAYIDRTRGVAETIASCTFELKAPDGTDAIASAAGTIPSDGVVEYWPSVDDVTLDASPAYRYQFTATRADGKTYKTGWIPYEIKG